MKIFVIILYLLIPLSFLPSAENTLSNEETKISEKQPSVPEQNTSIISIKNNIYVVELNLVNKIGIIFNVSGFTLTLTGAILWIYDYLGFAPVMRDLINQGQSYEEYTKYYSIDIALLSIGITSLVIGAGLVIASLPLILYKKKGKKIAINYHPGNIQSFYFSFQL